VIRVGWTGMLARARKRPQLVRVKRRASKRRRCTVRVDEATLTSFVDADAALPPQPLPEARLVKTTLAGDAHSWLTERATWLRPRAIPMLVAFGGMLAVLASVNYLSTMNRYHAEQAVHAAAIGGGPNHIVLEPAAAFTIRVRASR
jgi:hypothetical protein